MGIPTPNDRMGAFKQQPTWNDYIAYVKCDKLTVVDDVGNTLQWPDNLAKKNTFFTEYKGLKCVDFTDSSRSYTDRGYVQLPKLDKGALRARSYSAWIAMTSTDHKWQSAVSLGSAATSQQELNSPRNYQYTTELAPYGAGPNIQSGTSISLNKWYHYAVTYSDTCEYNLYLDGVNIYSSYAYQIDIESPYMYFGQSNGQTSNVYGFIGYLSTVRVWNRELSEAEVIDLAAELKPTV